MSQNYRHTQNPVQATCTDSVLKSIQLKFNNLGEICTKMSFLSYCDCPVEYERGSDEPYCARSLHKLHDLQLQVCVLMSLDQVIVWQYFKFTLVLRKGAVNTVCRSGLQGAVNGLSEWFRGGCE